MQLGSGGQYSPDRIAWTLAAFWILLTALPVILVVGTLAAAVAFVFVVDLAKFTVLSIRLALTVRRQ